MYYRLYPSKNNTIFRQFDAGTTDEQNWSKSVNLGANPVFELRDGASESKLILGFELNQWLRNKLTNHQYSCNLVLWDAGAVYDSLLTMKNIKFEWFNADFAEGDGWYFDKSYAKNDISNWVYNLENSLWSDVSTNYISDYHLNKNHEDIRQNVTAMFDGRVEDETAFYSLMISVVSPQPSANTFSKFMYSRHTKTVFKPFIEFYIEDNIYDKSSMLRAGTANKIYFINENGVDFTDDVSANVTMGETSSTISATKERDGVYYIEINPDEPARIITKEYVNVVWKIGSIDVYKQTMVVEPQNQFIEKFDYKKLNFYPVSPYTHNIVRQGDIMPFEIISELKGGKRKTLDSYEFRVVDPAGFEMVPWAPVSVYRDKMYFSINTDYFFPEQQYEVFVRNNINDGNVMTSKTSMKFKLTTNSASHLRELSANPYYSRESFFSK